MNDSILRGIRSDDPEWGAVPTPKRRNTRRKKVTVRRRHLALLLVSLLAAVFSVYEMKVSKTQASSRAWIIIFLITASGFLGILVLRMPDRKPRGTRHKREPMPREVKLFVAAIAMLVIALIGSFIGQLF